MSAQQISEALAALNAPMTLSIITLSEPLLSNNHVNVSNDNNGERITPASLQADLAHHKDLFSKLRFSYVEQVTKERFLKAISADPPELVDPTQNAALEEELKEAKAALKRKKVAMEGMVQEIEEMGRRLAQTHEIIQLQTTQLSSLPANIAALESHITTLLAARAPQSTDPEQNLPLHATTTLLSQREAEVAELDRRLSDMQSLLPTKRKEVSALKAELAPLEERKRKVIEEAREAKRKRGGGDRAGELEARGRWLKGVDAGLRVMLDV
ncbi:hypothetical protein BDV97DRAFT_339141 [Delphinella strobiligena]|nr:hypothetical protein BDV97DRAFT_339141 [Delphinella strobiligena]